MPGEQTTESRPADGSAHDRELLRMRLEMADQANADLMEALRRLPDDCAAAREAALQLGRSVERVLRSARNGLAPWHIEAIGKRSGAPLANLTIYAADRDDALAQAASLLVPSERYREPYSIVARPLVEAGEIVELFPHGGKS